MTKKPMGRIIILNGAPRSGKSSIVKVIQETFEGPWINLGVDVYVREITPSRYRPGIGLRPGGERQDLEELIPLFYAALYESIAIHSRLGLNVVVDVGHHDAYGKRTHILTDCAKRLAGLDVLFVGLRCPIQTILERRRDEPNDRMNEYLQGSVEQAIPAPILAWQEHVHIPGIYDLEIDTSHIDPVGCAAIIQQHIQKNISQRSAFETLAARSMEAR